MRQLIEGNVESAGTDKQNLRYLLDCVGRLQGEGRQLAKADALQWLFDHLSEAADKAELTEAEDDSSDEVRHFLPHLCAPYCATNVTDFEQPGALQGGVACRPVQR